VDAIMPLTIEDGDESLLEAARMGERRALDSFVRRHDGWVRSVVYSTLGNPGLVDDVVQHVWATVWQQIGTLAHLTHWRGWLYRMARNAAIDAGQKAARERRLRLAPESIDSAPAGGEEPSTALAREEQHQRVLAAIKGLPEIYREPFMLKHLENWSYAQIGEALSLPIDTVETRLVRARRLLRDALADMDQRRKTAER
jgi:RNA polymerase sigma-70 factor (ECF subfamily)